MFVRNPALRWRFYEFKGFKQYLSALDSIL